MDRILRISPILLVSFIMLLAPNDMQAKPPELPVTPNDQCLIPAAFVPQQWKSLLTLEFQMPDLEVETVGMPAEVEVLTVPPRPVPEIPASLRTPELPAIDSRLILVLEKIYGQVEAYRVIDGDIQRTAIGAPHSEDKH